MKYKELSEKIIGCAYRVYNQIPQSRHSGESRTRSEASALSRKIRWMPDQVRHDKVRVLFCRVNIIVLNTFCDIILRAMTSEKQKNAKPS